MKNIGKLILATIIIVNFAFQVNAGNTASSNQPAQKQNAVKPASGNFFVDTDFPGINQDCSIGYLFIS